MAGKYIEIPWGAEKVVYTSTFPNRDHFLGQRGMTPDGRTFRWSFSAGIIAAGSVVSTGPGIAADDEDLAVQAAAAVGDTTLAITTGGAVAANLYADGLVFVHITPGVGYQYAIRSHPATSGVATLILTLHESIRVALTTTSRVGLMLNVYKDVVISAAGGNAGAAIGVTCSDVTDNDYFWMQTSGPANVLQEDTAGVLGSSVQTGVNVDGAVQLHDTSVDTEDMRSLGTSALIAPTAGQHMMIILDLD